MAMALLAAALYALSTPLAKILLSNFSPPMMAGLLYTGAGVGMALIALLRRHDTKRVKQRFNASDRPYLVLMVVLDVAAPILLLYGLRSTTAANASLLNNFEIVATSLIALWFFRETISRRFWLGIVLVTVASIFLSISDLSAFRFSTGSLLVLAAATCWGLENNCTRKLAAKDPLNVVIVKGLCSGTVSLAIAAATGSFSFNLPFMLAALAVGFVAYGLSIFFYVSAQRGLGAAKTSTYYAVAPFIGAIFSIVIFREWPEMVFFAALAVLILGTYFTLSEARRKPENPTVQ
ncbi:MAG: DMT family transporter [bacterium]